MWAHIGLGNQIENVDSVHIYFIIIISKRIKQITVNDNDDDQNLDWLSFDLNSSKTKTKMKIENINLNTQTTKNEQKKLKKDGNCMHCYCPINM